jgi:hypothetical protein
MSHFGQALPFAASVFDSKSWSEVRANPEGRDRMAVGTHQFARLEHAGQLEIGSITSN